MRKLTLKQSKWLYHYLINGGNGRQATISAGYNIGNPHSADIIATDNLKNPTIREKLERAMAKLNITEDKLAEVLSDGLNAGLITYDKISGEYIQTDLPQHLTRHKFLETALDIIGAKAPTKTESVVNLRGVLAVGEIDKIRQRVKII
mgnify:CR=1 FL=1